MLTILASSDIPAADAWLCGMALRAGVTTCGDATAWVSCRRGEKRELAALPACSPRVASMRRKDATLLAAWSSPTTWPYRYLHVHAHVQVPTVREMICLALPCLALTGILVCRCLHRVCSAFSLQPASFNQMSDSRTAALPGWFELLPSVAPLRRCCLRSLLPPSVAAASAARCWRTSDGRRTMPSNRRAEDPTQDVNSLRPLSAATVAACRAALHGSSWAKLVEREDMPVMLSYSTAPSSHWLLGLSAARHGAPLVVAGLGRSKWPWHAGGRKKLPGSRRALQLISAVRPSARVLSTDTGDLLIANALTRRHRRLLEGELSSNPRLVLIGAECSSWPVCYREPYLADAALRQCFTSRAACFANSGVLLARAETLLDYYSLWAAQIAESRSSSSRDSRAERGNDQAAVHRLLLNRSMHEPRLIQRLDTDHLVSLQLWECAGPTRSKLGPFQKCHERRHVPLAGLHAESNGRVVRYRDTPSADAQYPFLVHSNGKHFAMRCAS